MNKEFTLEEIAKKCDMVLANTLGCELIPEMELNDDLEYEVFQYYIINESDYDYLNNFKNIILGYHYETDTYWFINDIVFGMSWEFIPMELKD